MTTAPTVALRYATPNVEHEPAECRFAGTVIRREAPRDGQLSPRYLCIGRAYFTDLRNQKPVYHNLFPAERLLEKNRTEPGVSLVLFDADQKIPFLHLGMRISVQLKRSGLVDPKKVHDISFLDFEYCVLFARGASCEPADLASIDLYANLASETSTAKVLEVCRRNCGHRVTKERQPLLFVDRKARQNCAPLSKARLAHQEYSSLMQAVSNSGVISKAFSKDMAMRFLAERSGTQWVNENHSLATLTQQFFLHRQTALTAAVCDLNALSLLNRAPLAPWRLFFAAVMPLTAELRLEPGVARYMGPIFDLSPPQCAAWLVAALPEKGPAFFHDLLAAAEAQDIELGDDDTEQDNNDEEDDEAKKNLATKRRAAERVLKLAHEMYRNALFAQRLGWDEEVYNVQAVAKRANKRIRANPVEAELAADYLFEIDAWHRVPVPQAPLMFGNDQGEESYRVLLACSTRDWVATTDLLATLDQVRDALFFLNTDGTPAPIYAGSQKALSVLFARRVVDYGWRPSEICWLTPGTLLPTNAAVPVLRPLGQFVTKDEVALRGAAELVLNYRALVVCDAHMFRRDELLVLFSFFRTLQCERAAVGLEPLRFILAGDTLASQWETGNLFATLFARGTGVGVDRIGRMSMMPAKTGNDAALQSLRVTLRAAASSAGARDRLVDQLFGRQRLDFGVCIVPSLQPLIEVFMKPKKKRRYILIGQSYELAGAEVARILAESIGLMVEAACIAPLAKQLLATLERPRRALESLLFLVAPYVGFRRRCVRVLGAWRAQEVVPSRHQPWSLGMMLDLDMSPLNNRNDNAALSLDDPLLFIDLDTTHDNSIDHRVCCNSWSATVAHALTHRHELTSQSFPLAHAALPLDGNIQHWPELVLCASPQDYFRFEDLYDSMIVAMPVACQLTIAGITRHAAAEMVCLNRSNPRTLLDFI